MGSKSLDEIHGIMEKIYNEEKKFTREERIQRMHQEAQQLVKQYNLNLKYPIKEKIVTNLSRKSYV